MSVIAPPDLRRVIAARAGQELRDGQVVNLGAGIPNLLASYVPVGVELVFQSENGAVGLGPPPEPGREDPDCCNASGQPATLRRGGSFVDTTTSFSMIRGGHIDVTFLGALQVDGEGNVASYEIPGERQWGMGGAMDLVAGARAVYVLTEHCSKDGSPKLLKRCTFPLTGSGVCDVIVTERALFRRYRGIGFVLEEVAKGHAVSGIAEITEMDYTVSDNVTLDAYGG